MPARAVKGPEGESIWNRAVATAQKQYPGLKNSDSSRFYAIVMTIYKNMCSKHECTPKSKHEMSMVLNRIELLEGMDPLPSSYYGWKLNEPLDSISKKTMSELVKKLNSAMRLSFSELKSWMDKNEIDISKKEDFKRVGKNLYNTWGKNIKPIIDNKKYNKTGISDVDPIYEAGQRLIDYIKKYYNITGWTNLGEYIF